MGANPPQRDTISTMGRVLLVVLVACGSPPPPAAPLKNVAVTTARAPATSPCGIADLKGRGAGTLYGAVCDPETHEWLTGVTVAATSPNLQHVLFAISNEHGMFSIYVPPGDYTVTYYYAECTWERHHHVDGAATPAIYDPLIQKGCR
jgi:hypothetical protein